MQNYTHSFQLFARMMARETEISQPDQVWDTLKSLDPVLQRIEGDTYDGLYMYFKGRYLYSWDTPYSQYEDTGYVATERPWYRDAVKGAGEIVLTPPYMSYANHYILSTVSQLQPDGETVFAYDIKMGDIQDLVASLGRYEGERVMVFDRNGTVIGSTDENYLGGNLYATAQEDQAALDAAREELDHAAGATEEQVQKLREQVQSAEAFHAFLTAFEPQLKRLKENPGQAVFLRAGNRSQCGYLLCGKDYNILLLSPVGALLGATVQTWLVPLLLVELLIVYFCARVSKERRNRELREAYVELGQTQKRLELALSAAQKAAAVDELTGILNLKSFRKGVVEQLEAMGPEERGILIMIDGDHFKSVNDQFGHDIGDEVIKVSAQMIVGRIRTIDLASRLHGDEFAIFVQGTEDYGVAQRIMADINATLRKEAARRNIPGITLSAGAVVARRGDDYEELAKAADEALYKAKATHNGGFFGVES
jgi:diguanylate cyclase (GGDEF)-like protein